MLVLSTTIHVWTTSIVVTSVDVTGSAHRAAMKRVMADIRLWDARFNRFHGRSMVSRLNRASGAWFKADDVFVDLLASARDGVFLTGGKFDPAILPHLEAAGYLRSFGVPGGRAMLRPQGDVVLGVDAWRAVEIDRASHRVRLPRSMRIDLGGIAKGALADRIADRLTAWPGGAINIGGDLRVWGLGPDGGPWRVGIEDPAAPARDITSVTMHHPEWAALATSTPLKRRWRTRDGEAHHLIDPATGGSVQSSLASVTCCASTAAGAEIATKAIFMNSEPGRVPVRLPDNVHWALTIGIAGDMMVIKKDNGTCNVSDTFPQPPCTHPNRELAPRCSSLSPARPFSRSPCLARPCSTGPSARPPGISRVARASRSTC